MAFMVFTVLHSSSFLCGVVTATRLECYGGGIREFGVRFVCFVLSFWLLNCEILGGLPNVRCVEEEAALSAHDPDLHDAVIFLLVIL